MHGGAVATLRVRQRYGHRPAMDPLGRFWQGYYWSAWWDFPAFLLERPARDDAVSRGAGIYRFAVPRRRGLLYIGQASVLRRRLAGHARAVTDIQGPNSRRHLGFHHELASHLATRGRVAVSWTGLEGLEKADRLGIECDLIAAHRTIVGGNPTWQFLPMSDGEDLQD